MKRFDRMPLVSYCPKLFQMNLSVLEFLYVALPISSVKLFSSNICHLFPHYFKKNYLHKRSQITYFHLVNQINAPF